jgi:peptide/nickel transport system substrate-binding protein
VVVYISPQFDSKSPWADPRVRKAASLAIDRQTLIDIHSTGATPIGSLGLKGDPATVEFPADPYDPAQAKRLLAEAGFPNGFKGGKFYPEGGFWAQGEQVANYWKAVGINVDITLVDRPALLTMMSGGKLKGSSFIIFPTGPAISQYLSYLFGPGSFDNYPDIQALWDQYQKSVDPNVRKDLIVRIQNLIHERTMWVCINTGITTPAVGPRVKGDPHKVQPLIWFTAPFEDIELAQ